MNKITMTENNQGEVVITSDVSGQLWNCCQWDMSTGSTLRLFKSGCSSAGTVCVIGNDYLIGAEPNKPILNVWSIRSMEQSHQRIICPGRISSLTVTIDGTYCVASIGVKILIWQVCTGELMTTISRHYQPVTCLKTADVGSCFISAGEDGLVLVWDLGQILNSVMHPCEENEGLLFRWSHHSLPVTGVHIGKGGRRTRATTVSLDQTCRVYSMANGDLLLTVVFDVSLTAVTMDNAEYFIFCGSNDGRILQVNLFDPPPTVEHHFLQETVKSNEYLGHNKPILCLAVSDDGRILISGSQDATAKIWNVASRQCLHTLNHKGPVTNVLVMYKTDGCNWKQDKTPKLPLNAFCSNLCGSDGADTWKHKATVRLHTEPQTNNYRLIREHTNRLRNEESKSVRCLQEQVAELKSLNSELYKVTVDKLL